MTSPDGNLFQQQEANRRRTTWLVIGFVLFFAWLGFGGDYILALATTDSGPHAYHHVFPWLGIVLTLTAIITARYAYKTGPEKVLWSTGAREVIDPQTDGERQLYNDTATQYTTKQQQFPTTLVAGMAHAAPADLWEIEDQAERAVPQVDLSRR